MTNKILVTAALPYANGDIHLGHLVEYLQADMFVRALNLSNKTAYYICANDTHGTPIEVNAQKQGISPKELVQKYHLRHQEDFSRFGIEFSFFGSTDDPENKKFAYDIYEKLKSGGHITKKIIEQAFCNTCKRFLPDRFIKGTCPKCKAADQYGDVCEVCNSTYDSQTLIEPFCILCKSTPVIKSTEEIFFQLKNFEPFLMQWMESHVSSEVKNFIQTWIKDGLQDWCISREGPYFGFEIPGENHKFFYVWLDAPIGYISASSLFFKKQNISFEDFWKSEENQLIHIIGKDIIYFHTLFWPAMLHGAKYRVPSRVHVHGMLTINGEKMSKSRGTFINAHTYLKHLDPQYLRFYYASKLSSGIEDLDINFEDFVNRINSDLVNNIANLVNRVIPFVNNRLNGEIGICEQSTRDLQSTITSKMKEVQEHYLQMNFHKAIRLCCEIADIGNKYFQDAKPWDTIKTDTDKTKNICAFIANVCKAVSIAIKPALPLLAQKIENQLNIEHCSFASELFDIHHHKVGKSEHLIERIDMKSVQAIIDDSKEFEPVSSSQTIQNVESVSSNEITIDDFTKVDLRIGEIISAEIIEGSNKLLKLCVKADRERTVFAGIRKAFNPEQLIGKKIVVVINLKPRKMPFGISEGMVLAAGEKENELFLPTFEPNAKTGTKLK